MPVVGFAALSIVMAYVLGSLPVGVLIGRALGRDPRTVGSGRTGGTNVFRAVGMPAAIATVVGDILKGWVAVELAGWLMAGTDHAPLVQSLAALAAILGHNYSVFLGFTGGAGSTPNLGALFAFEPRLALFGLLLGIAIVFGLRIASVASLGVSATVALVMVVLVRLYGRPEAYLVYAFGQLLLLAWALRPNLARLRAGTERRISFGSRRGEP